VSERAFARARAASPRLITVGGVCDSMIFSVDAIPPLPGKVLASKLVHIVDGMSLSAGYAFMRLGGQAQVCARVGDDHVGRTAREDLAAEGLDTSGLRCVAGARTSLAVTIVERDGNRLVVPYHDEAVDKSPDWLPLADIARADMVLCDTRWIEGAEYALLAARDKGVPSMIDADVAPLDVLHRLVPLATYAVFSDAGLCIYAGCDDIDMALRRVAADHGGHVGATCGERGYFWFEDGAIRSVPAPVVEVVDTLSAGDIFHGAFALALLEGRDIRDAARFACVAASLKCTRFGGRLGCPTRPEVDACVRATSGAD
jgi:sulfofructose kinase